ncbi:MAG: hypothetical protein M3P08_13315 [Thermoproteota archaeon]|nr:hypothetical protein [Thermoproteota archaeon]
MELLTDRSNAVRSILHIISQVDVAIELNGSGKVYRYESSAIQILIRVRRLSFRRATKPKHDGIIRNDKI